MSKALVKQGKNDLALILEQKGMTHDMVATKLMELLDWEDVKYDKNGNAYTARDGNLRLKAIELWIKLQGGSGKTNQHLHVTEGVLDKLLSKGKGTTKKRK